MEVIMGLFSSSNAVFDMLKADHKRVKGLFEQFEKAKDSRSKARIVQETLRELDVHAKLEETLIYPLIRRKIDATDIMDEALEEHHVAHVLINELKRMNPGEGRYGAKFTVLGESIKHHIGEEEDQMFPEAEDVDIDWDELFNEAMKRKQGLLSQQESGNTQKPRRSIVRKTGKAKSTPRTSRVKRRSQKASR
ncbi:MAG: hemerythrin domain-containing protein [Nitrospirota bacterium]